MSLTFIKNNRIIFTISNKVGCGISVAKPATNLETNNPLFLDDHRCFVIDEVTNPRDFIIKNFQNA